MRIAEKIFDDVNRERALRTLLLIDAHPKRVDLIQVDLISEKITGSTHLPFSYNEHLVYDISRFIASNKPDKIIIDESSVLGLGIKEHLKREGLI